MVNPSESFILLLMTRTILSTHLPGNAMGIDIDGQSYFASFHQLTNSDLPLGTSLNQVHLPKGPCDVFTWVGYDRFSQRVKKPQLPAGNL